MNPHEASKLPTIFWISGPPAAGKSTLCAALLTRFDRAIHLPVDDMREWVVQGRAESVPWTDETERQFRIVEGAVCDIARRYQTAGFTVAIDHCRNPARLDDVILESGLAMTKVLLMPDLDSNLDRSHRRQNKNFDPHLLDDTIRFTNDRYRQDATSTWMVIDNSELTVEETIDRILG